jgi:preprotein translocase subunit SecA
MMMLVTEPGQPLQYKPLNRMITKAQEAVETENRLVREHMIKYDQANNEHREQIYCQRNEILLTQNPREMLEDMFYDLSDDIIDKHIPDGEPPESWDVNSVVNEYFNKVAYVSMQLDVTGMTKDDFKIAFRKLDRLMIDLKERQIGDPDIAKSVERTVMLRFIDRHWIAFLSSMEYIKQNIGSQVYAHRDPVMEYKKKGVELFNTMIDDIKNDVVVNFNRCQVRVNNEPAPENTNSNATNVE